MLAIKTTANYSHCIIHIRLQNAFIGPEISAKWSRPAFCLTTQDVTIDARQWRPKQIKLLLSVQQWPPDNFIWFMLCIHTDNWISTRLNISLQNKSAARQTNASIIALELQTSWTACENQQQATGELWRRILRGIDSLEPLSKLHYCRLDSTQLGRRQPVLAAVTVMNDNRVAHKCNRK